MVHRLGQRLSLLLAVSALSTLPAHAIVGNLGAYSAHHVRHISNQLQQARTRHHQSVAIQPRERKLHHALAHLGRFMFHTRNERMPRPAKDRQISQGKMSHKVEKATDSRVFLDETPIPDLEKIGPEERQEMSDAFGSGTAYRFSPTQLADAQVFAFVPLKGSVFNRREPIKFIVLHSTETARPADAPRVISSWNNRGRRHPGAQFVVDRDGSIYNTVNPQFATVHVDTRRTKYGVNNDNSIGIEIVHTGKQEYTDLQINSVACLVSYLQSHYNISSEHVYTHHFVQPSDRTDPVAFDWDKFSRDAAELGNNETALNR